MRFAPVFASLLIASVSFAAETRSFVATDSSKSRLAIIAEDGTTEFETPIGPLHDVHVLPNGNVLFQSDWKTLVEMSPESRETVWTYDSRKAVPDYKGRLEVHAFQRLDDGHTMIAISGPSVIVEVSADGEVTKRFKMDLAESHPHRDTRLVRKLSNGHYLACHEGAGKVTEYDENGAVVWQFDVPLVDYPGSKPRETADGHGPEAFGNQCFSAIRLSNGNTLIGTGNGHAVIEVTPAKEVVWSLGQNELPGITLAWVTSLEVLPSGNIVIGNCHAGPDHPQLVEVNRDKQVVWTFRDFDRFGNATTNSQILSVNGQPTAGKSLR